MLSKCWSALEISLKNGWIVMINNHGLNIELTWEHPTGSRSWTSWYLIMSDSTFYWYFKPPVSSFAARFAGEVTWLTRIKKKRFGNPSINGSNGQRRINLQMQKSLKSNYSRKKKNEGRIFTRCIIHIRQDKWRRSGRGSDVIEDGPCIHSVYN